MNLLSIEEIKSGLDNEFLPLEPMLTGFRLLEGGLTNKQMLICEGSLGVKLPIEFRQLITRYKFSNFAIGPISFGSSDDYVHELISYKELGWWAGASKPKDLILIAISDPYSFLLNVVNGQVLIMDVEVGVDQAVVISSSFELFLRGVGTVLLLRNDCDDKQCLAESVNSMVNGEYLDFWTFLAH